MNKPDPTASVSLEELEPKFKQTLILNEGVKKPEEVKTPVSSNK